MIDSGLKAALSLDDEPLLAVWALGLAAAVVAVLPSTWLARDEVVEEMVMAWLAWGWEAHPVRDLNASRVPNSSCRAFRDETHAPMGALPLTLRHLLPERLTLVNAAVEARVCA
jgi:hypothetical protein